MKVSYFPIIWLYSPDFSSALELVIMVTYLVKVPLELHGLDLLDLLAEAKLLGEPVEAGVGGGQVVDGGPRPPDGVGALGALRPDREFDDCKHVLVF